MSKKQVVTVYCGVSASGKSTNVEELRKLGWKFVELNRDEWRFKLFTEGEPSWAKYKFTKERENAVTEKLNELFDYAVAQMLPVIVSNTNLNKKDHDYWKAKADAVGYDFEVKYFPVTLTEAIKRDKKRGALSVGQDVIFDQWQKWLTITEARKYVPNEFKPKAMWIDLDGTVAESTYRGHHEYTKVLTDTPRLDVISLISSWIEREDIVPVFMTGRPESCREDTLKWLSRYFDVYENLYMRETGDFRCDSIVKEELFWRHLAPNWNIVAAIDDRPKITRKQKDIGIPLVINVSKTYKDF